MQTRKRQFIDDFDRRQVETNEHVTKMVVAVKLPTGHTELIINTEAIKSKVAYYDTAYDDHMCLKKNPAVEIIRWMFV